LTLTYFKFKISNFKFTIVPIVPTIVEKSQRGERVYDIFSRLLEERIVFLAGPVTDLNANVVIAQMLYLVSKDPKRDIKLYINSPGGSVTAGLAIYDTMQYIKCPVSTICVGLSASMGAVLLAAGTKGKRFALPNAEILLHQVSSGFQGQATDIDITAKQIIKIKGKMNQILSNHTGQPIERVEKDTDRDFYMTAQEAKEYGLIDDVIGSMKEGK
jgi:ATP-dependent Clp protease protease subunit